MDIRLIGTIKDIKETLLGFRIMDIDEKKIMDVPANNLISVLSSKKTKVEGLKYENGSLIGTNGNIARYPVIVNGKLVGKSSMIILEQLTNDGNTIGYRVVDWKGTILKLPLAEVIDYANKNGISNGAVKTLNNNTFISPINGEYKKIEVKVQKKKVIEQPASTKEHANDAITDMEKYPWTFNEFKLYMDNNGYQYDTIDIASTSGYRKEIEFLCPEAKVIKYPLGVTRVSSKFFSTPSEVEEVIFSKDIREIDNNILYNGRNIKKLYFQDGVEELEAYGISAYKHRIALEKIVFPKSLKHVEGFSGLFGLKELELAHTSITRLEDSFNDLADLEYLSLPEGLEYIRGCFRGLSKLKVLKLPSTIQRINNTFAECGIEVLDLSKCNNLERISHSAFRDCKNLKQIILPEGIKTLDYYSFMGCTELSSVNIPSTLEVIGTDIFSESKIESITIPNTLLLVSEGAFNKDTRIIFDSSNKEIKRSILHSAKQSEIVLSEGVEIIHNSAFEYCDSLKSINIPVSLQEIRNNVFKNCNSLIELTGIEKASNLKKIGEYAFYNCRLTDVELPEGLEEIGVKAFFQCRYLKSVLLPKSLLKLGRNSISNTGSAVSSGTTFYVYDKSPAARYCKRNNLKYITINSLSDYYSFTNSNREISKTKQAKLHLLLASSENHKELLSERFINYADLLYNLYNYITEPYKQIHKNSMLDTSKFIEFPLDKIEVLHSTIKSLNPKLDNNLKEELFNEYSNDNLNPIFINLSNYITSNLEFNAAPLTTNSLKYTQEAKMNMLCKVIYVDNCSSILLLYFYNMSSSPYFIPIIIIDNKIRFVSSLDNTEYTSFINTLSNEQPRVSKANNSIASLLKIGDTIDFSNNKLITTNISGSEVPHYINKAITNNIIDNFDAIGSDYLTSTPKDTQYVTVDIMCKETGKVITAQCKLYYTSRRLVSNIRGAIESMTIVNIQEYSNLDKDTMDRVARGIDCSKSKRFFAFAALGKEYTDKLKSLENAYDDEPCYEWEVSKILRQYDLKCGEDLNVAMFNLIKDTIYFSKTRKKIVDIKKVSVNNSMKSYEIEGGDYSIVQFSLKRTYRVPAIAKGKATHIVCLIDNSKENVGYVECYYTSYGLESIISEIIGLYAEGNSPRLIDNDVIDVEDFISGYTVIQNTGLDLVRRSVYYNLNLAIKRDNGAVYLISQKYTRNVIHKLFRFKSTELAIQQCKWMTVNSLNDLDNEENRKISRLLDIANWLVKGEAFMLDGNEYYNMREEVLNGIPNGHYVNADDLEFFDSLAKQPLIQ